MFVRGLLIALSGFLFIFSPGLPMGLLTRRGPALKPDLIYWGIGLWLLMLLPSFFLQSLLRQAVLNLIKNGLEVMSQGGTLTVTTRQTEEWVEIAIGDTGPGIPPEVGRRLFEQFFTTKPQGTGLGLPISRQIVEEHGGRIDWESIPGAGATFTVRLPLKR